MYESPVELIITEIHNQIVKQQEEEVFKAVISFVPNVNKEELLRALRYDREQYEKGYADAMASIVRCADCRDCEMCYPEKLLDREATQAWLCKRYKLWRKPDDFCSYGERR